MKYVFGGIQVALIAVALLGCQTPLQDTFYHIFDILVQTGTRMTKAETVLMLMNAWR